MKRLSPRSERILAAVGLAAAFVMMASIFVPLHSSAATPTPVGPRPSRLDADPPRVVPHDSDWSTNPHDGLPLLGCIEQGGMELWIYGGEEDLRYSIYDGEGVELGILLRADQVAERFPELDPAGMQFQQPFHIMHIDPAGKDW